MEDCSMYAYIKGRLESRGDGYIIIDNGGIGYRIFVLFFTLGAAGQRCNGIKVYSPFYVREGVLR